MPSMVVLASAFLMGALSLSLLTQLPQAAVFVAIAVASLAAFVWTPYRTVACIAAGVAMTGLAAHSALTDRLAPNLEGRAHQLSVRIADFPGEESEVIRMTVVPIGRSDLPARLRLSWVGWKVIPRIGETWRLTVRLRRPAGYSNPHGFDFEKWLVREGIGATGYVVEEAHNYLIHGEPRKTLDVLRDHVVLRIAEHIRSEGSAAILMAIAVGARQQIDRQQWDLFAATGTTHLMAISGLHVGLAAASAYFILRFLLAPLFACRNARSPALAGAALAAMAYVILSGLGLPALRALVMVLIALILVIGRRSLPPSNLLAWALLLVLAADPLASMAPGFRLSFGAVVILLVSLRLDEPARHASRFPWLSRAMNGSLRLVRMQFALLIGLFPLSVMEFDRVSIAAPAVNLLAMPVFNFVTVPSVLLGMAFDGALAPLGSALIQVAGQTAGWAREWIRLAGSVEWLSFRTADPVHWVVLLLAPVGLLCPRGVPGREIGVACLLYALSFRPAPPPAGCFDLHTLDVGQGLSVVVQTRHEVLLYDTGPSYRNGSGTVELVVLPFLQSIGVRRVDRVILSHDDLDHSGGIHALLRTIDVGEVIASTPGLEGVTDTLCEAGLSWRTDGIDFRILHPRFDSPWTGNNASCVLAIRTGEPTVLLPGDIEKPVEILMAYRQEFPRSTLVVVPHHGSRTSSSDALVRATRPAIAIVPAAWKNRWGFPKPEIVNRWQQAGALVLNTATDGAISVRVCRDGIQSTKRNRERYRQYWHEDRKPPS